MIFYPTYEKINKEYSTSQESCYITYIHPNIYLKKIIIDIYLDWKIEAFSITVHNYRPCKKCGFYGCAQDSSIIATYMHTPFSHDFEKYNIDINCKKCEKFVNCIVKRNLFIKYFISKQKSTTVMFYDIIVILTDRFENLD